jgi:hypothetical protein
MDALYYDERAGGYLSTAREREDSILSLKEVQDGAEPSPNSVAARNLLALGIYFEQQDYRARAEEILKSTVTTLQQHPYAVPEMGVALARALRPPRQAVLVQEADHPLGAELAEVLRRDAPDDFLLFSLTPSRDRTVFSHAALAAMQPGPKGAAVYLCENLTCSEPVDDAKQLNRIIKPPS